MRRLILLVAIMVSTLAIIHSGDKVKAASWNGIALTKNFLMNNTHKNVDTWYSAVYTQPDGTRMRMENVRGNNKIFIDSPSVPIPVKVNVVRQSYLFASGVGYHLYYPVFGFDPFKGTKLWEQSRIEPINSAQAHIMAFDTGTSSLYTAGVIHTYDGDWNDVYTMVSDKRDTKGNVKFSVNGFVNINYSGEQYEALYADPSGYYLGATRWGVGISLIEKRSTKDGSVLWTSIISDGASCPNGATAIVLLKGLLYVATYNGTVNRIYTVDPKTGAANIVLQTSVNITGLAVGGGKLYYYNSPPLGIGPGAITQLNGWSIPAVSDSGLIAADDTGIYAYTWIPEEWIGYNEIIHGFIITKYSLADGHVIWATPYNNSLGMASGVWLQGDAPALTDEGVFVSGYRQNGSAPGKAAYNGCIIAFNKMTGKFNWDYFLDDSYGNSYLNGIAAGTVEIEER